MTKMNEEVLSSQIMQKNEFITSPTGVTPMTFQNIDWMLLVCWKGMGLTPTGELGNYLSNFT